MRAPSRHLVSIWLGLAAACLAGCTSVSVDLGPNSILGKGGLDSTLKTLSKSSYSSAGTYVAAVTADPTKKIALGGDLGTDFARTVQACQEVFVGLDERANTYRWTAFAVAMIGSVAGAVVVPALTAANPVANKAAIAALGGVAGATNTAQTALKEQGLTATEAVTAREQLRKSFNAAIETYLTAETDIIKIQALQRVAVTCVSYAIQSPTVKILTGP